MFVTIAVGRTLRFRHIDNDMDGNPVPILAIINQPKFWVYIKSEKIICPTHNALLPMGYFVQVVM